VSSQDVAPDGSPIAIYRRLPAEPEFTPILRLLKPPMRVLDLGCGVGRLANQLAEAGCTVTGVDESAEMLAHLHPGVTRVQDRIDGLELGSSFDAVVLASHLINVADPALRAEFLRSAARHVAPEGVILVEHWEVPDVQRPTDSDGAVGEVSIQFRVLAEDGDDFEARVVYTLGEHSWTQTFRATLLDEAALDRQLAAAGLRRERRLSPKWLAATLAEDVIKR
jgi:SAM-dependent methyltransferase